MVAVAAIRQISLVRDTDQKFIYSGGSLCLHL